MSAWKAKISVLMTPIPKPSTAKKASATAGAGPGATATPTPAAAPMAPDMRYARFLPRAWTALGTTAAAAIIPVVCTTVITM